MFGLGGIWIEALNDVRLTSASLSKEGVVAQLKLLRGHALLSGFRGGVPIDMDALAEFICAVGRLLVAHPEIVEIDINPVVAFPVGKRPVALDALIILEQPSP